jgi:uncharacterized protein involved in exopolysaccharide biosynthesis
MPSSAPSPGSFATWLRIGRRRRAGGAATFAVVAGAALGIVFLTRPVYRADARLRLAEPPPSTGVAPAAGFMGLLRLGGDPFANDLELLASRTLAEGVVEDAALHVRLRAPRGWHRDSLFASVEAGRATRRAAYRLAWQDNGRVRAVRTAPRDSVIGIFEEGERIEMDGIVVVPASWRPGMPRAVRLHTEPFDDVVQQTRRRLRIDRTRREANVLELAYQTTDPAVAQRVVGSAVSRFVMLRAGLLGRESAETVDSLRVVAVETQRELRTAEDALEQWQRTTRLVAPDAQAEALVARYTALRTDLETARFEQAAIDSVLHRLPAPGRGRAWMALLAYPRFLDNETVGLLVQRLAALEEARTELVTRRAATSREVGVLDRQTLALDDALRAVALNVRTAGAERIADLEARVDSLDRALDAMPGRAVELARRQRDVRLLGEVVVLTEQRLRQEELRQALTFANVQVIDPPALRSRPIWPRRGAGAAIGLALAALAAVLAMVVADRADPTIRRASQVRAAAGAPVLAVLPERGSRLDLPDAEAAVVLGRRNGRPPRIAVTGLARGEAERLARQLAASDAASAAGADIVLAAPLSSLANAALAAADGAVLAVVRVGRTRADALARAAHWLREAGGTLHGVVLIAQPDETDGAWE